ncbi:MAG: transcriptional repressor [Paludibacteraceae bacterium]|nr:transcriptional repressor [Paludibacteraceae bacterium]
MMNSDIYLRAEQILLEYQGMHKMRNTPERRLILRTIASHGGRFTVAQVKDWIKDAFISQATVYNTLQLFEKAGIVHCLRKQHSSRVMEYELQLGEQSAMQIICTKCGRVATVKDMSAETALRMKNYPNFIMHHFSIYVFGECKHCRKTSNL